LRSTGLKDYYGIGKEAIQWERFFELAPSKVTRGHRYKLFREKRNIRAEFLVQDL